MARQRTIKFPPKRGKLTIRQIERAVNKVTQQVDLGCNDGIYLSMNETKCYIDIKIDYVI